MEGLCVSVFWGRCVGLLLSCCLLVDCAGVFWSFDRCFDMTHAAFCGPGRWSQRRTRSRLLLQGPRGVATRLVRRIGGPAVDGDSDQHAGYGRHHLRWGKAQEGQGKRRDGSSGANGNGTIAICAAKCGSSDPRGATGVQ